VPFGKSSPRCGPCPLRIRKGWVVLAALKFPLSRWPWPRSELPARGGPRGCVAAEGGAGGRGARGQAPSARLGRGLSPSHPHPAEPGGRCLPRSPRPQRLRLQEREARLDEPPVSLQGLSQGWGCLVPLTSLSSAASPPPAPVREPEECRGDAVWTLPRSWTQDWMR
jgi:hypothetical protein